MGASNQSRVERFIGQVALDAAEHGWELRLIGAQNVYTDPRSKGDDSRCLGYTAEAEQVIAIAMNSPRWLAGLAHEFAHFKLYTERSDAENVRSAEAFNEAVPVLERWVKYPGTKLIDEDDAWVAAKVVAKEEACAEVRAAKLVCEYKLPVDKARIARAANAYMLTFAFTVVHRVWFNRDLFDDPGFLGGFPATLRAMEFARALKTSYRQYAPVFERFALK